MSTYQEVPVDTRESPTEFVVVVPLGWVEKESVQISLQGSELTISWMRKGPQLKEQLVQKKADCYWWAFQTTIQLPASSIYHTISSSLSPDNVLQVIVPKVYEPERIAVQIQ